MREIQLSGGDVVKVGVRHGRRVMTFLFPKYCDLPVRFTEVFLKRGDHVLAQAEAVCSPDDNFCRRTGRKVAAARLLKQLREKAVETGDGTYVLVGVESRRRIFLSICPEYGRTRIKKGRSCTFNDGSSTPTPS